MFRTVLVRFVTSRRKHDKHLVSAAWKDFVTYAMCLKLTPRGLYELYILLFTATRLSWVAYAMFGSACGSDIALWRNTSQDFGAMWGGCLKASKERLGHGLLLEL